MRPLIKWVGGKRRLLEELNKILPKQINTYYEPFLGSGALFWHLASGRRFQRAVLNDKNAHLMDFYRVVRDFPAELVPLLRESEALYAEDPEWHHRNNALSIFLDKLHPVQRAERFATLTRSSFNGLWRVNKLGKFNVPWNKRTSLRLQSKEEIETASKLLNRFVQLRCDHYVDILEEAKSEAVEGDLIFLDPPYLPKSATSQFVSYTAEGFGMADQIKLASYMKVFADKGVLVVATNNDVPAMDELYKGCETHLVSTAGCISAKASARKPMLQRIVINRFDFEPPAL